MRHLQPLAALTAAAIAACASPYSVVRVDPERVYRAEAVADAGAGPSESTRRTLRVQNLDELWDAYPELALRTLDQIAAESDDRELVAAAAELAWLQALRLELARSGAATGFYLLAAARSYRYLMAPASPMERAFDPGFDFLSEIYRKAAGAYLRDVLEASHGELRDHFTEVLRETYRVRIERGSRVWSADFFDELLLAGTLEVEGFRNHYRQAGLGVPLVGVRQNRRAGPVEQFYPPEGFFYPVTAVLRFGADELLPPDELALFDDFVSRQGQRTAVLSLYDPLRLPAIEIDGLKVPLAADFTAPFGLFMDRARLRHLSIAGLLDIESAAEHQGLFMIEPYDPDKIPVLMIHGLKSSAHVWAELTNDLNGDAELRRAYQVWHYLYPSGLPYLYSGCVLRRELDEVRRVFDPHGTHAAMKSMVIVAHSLGGLLAKTLVSSSGTKLWDAIATVPPEGLRGDPEQVERFKSSFVFEPLPWVERVIFISTPHRGSHMADAFVGRLSSALVNLPDDYKETYESVAKANLEVIRPEVRKILVRGGPNSIQALSPQSRILRLLAEIPVDPRVKAHTIIGDRDLVTGDPEIDSDGVVTHESAHIDEAVSEITVPSRHDAYAHPLTILEVKRILRLHLRERSSR